MAEAKADFSDRCCCGRVGDTFALLLCPVDAPIPFLLSPKGQRTARHMKQWGAIYAVAGGTTTDQAAPPPARHEESHMIYPPTTCYRCGGVADILVDDGTSAVCQRCEEAYQAHLQATYPYGQCQQCGAEYRPYLCVQARTHVYANHAEGGCSQWADQGDGEPIEPMWIALGYCGVGCHPSREVLDAYDAAHAAATMIWYDQHYRTADVRRLKEGGFPLPADDELIDLPF
jgi:hypothetical protein